jgi:hypothetical protein
MHRRLWPAALVLALVPGTSADEAKRGAYEKTKDTKGVVLISVNWSRGWNYCGFENVQLRRLAFERMPVSGTGDDSKADLELEGRGLTAMPGFEHLALLVDPGEYALTGFLIRAAKSVDDTGELRGTRSQLFQDGKPVAGSFDVKAGEIVYVGHFAPECPEPLRPTVWRYYTDGEDAFREHLESVRRKYGFLPVDRAVFRLFRTTTIGQPFEPE